MIGKYAWSYEQSLLSSNCHVTARQVRGELNHVLRIFLIKHAHLSHFLSITVFLGSVILGNEFADTALILGVFVFALECHHPFRLGRDGSGTF